MYLALKERSPEQVTSEEVLITSGKKLLNLESMLELLGKYEATSTSIQAAFKKQVDAAAVCCTHMPHLINLLAFLRALGIRITLKTCSLSGWFQQTNHSTSSTNVNSRNY